MSELHNVVLLNTVIGYRKKSDSFIEFNNLLTSVIIKHVWKCKNTSITSRQVPVHNNLRKGIEIRIVLKDMTNRTITQTLRLISFIFNVFTYLSINLFIPTNNKVKYHKALVFTPGIRLRYFTLDESKLNNIYHSCL